jgi:hypothetical protein
MRNLHRAPRTAQDNLAESQLEQCERQLTSVERRNVALAGLQIVEQRLLRRLAQVQFERRAILAMQS